MRKWLAASLALGTASLAAAHPAHAPEHAPEHDGPYKVVVVLAHPDDELVFAPAIHGLAKGGFEVTVVFATNGDQGPGVSGMKPGNALAKARIAEAHCSTNALGVTQMYRLALGDGTLGIEARKQGSAAKRMLGEIGEYLEGATKVITWGPEGGYGHSDHRMVGAVVTQHLQSLPPAERPELLYPALVNSPLPDMLVEQGWTTTSPDLAPVDYAYNPADLAAATTATQCHKTQFDDATRAALVPGFDALVWKGKVSFRKAF